jgi:hypothetical protein
MDRLPTCDLHHLRSAEGWLELGNCLEAHQDLDRITPELRTHPDVLILRWRIYQHAQNWDACLMVARSLTEGAPNDPRGWIALAQNFYFQKRYQDAYDLIVSKITTFPKHWPLYYDAACYACLSNRLDQAKQFLQLAMTFGDAMEVRRRAWEDPDLGALRKKSSEARTPRHDGSATAAEFSMTAESGEARSSATYLQSPAANCAFVSEHACSFLVHFGRGKTLVSSIDRNTNAIPDGQAQKRTRTALLGGPGPGWESG